MTASTLPACYVFHRTCRVLHMANLAMLVNVLPAITRFADGPARFTPLAHPFVLYRSMEALALQCRTFGPTFDAPALGLNIAEKTNLPWLDMTATRSDDGTRLVLGLINRHPAQRLACRVTLSDLPVVRATRCRRMSGHTPLAQDVDVHTVRPPRVRGQHIGIKLPPASLTVVELEKE